MIAAGLVIAVVLAGGVNIGRQDSAPASDRLAYTCLSEGQMLFVAGLAVAVESPNANAANQTARIAEACRQARTGLAPQGHVCLSMITNFERLATELSDVYSGRVSVADYIDGRDASNARIDHDDNQLAAEQCEGRIAAFQTATEENQ